MKRIIGLFLMIAICCSSHFSSAQMMLKLPYDHITDEPIGIDLTLKTAKLQNGVELQYAEQGLFTGTPVIFLHGVGDSWHSFESVLPLLPYNIHAFAISQRGHGDSDRPLTGYTPKDFAGDVAEFMKTQDLNSAYIVGHSMGGVVAQQFALDYPQLTKGIVLIGSTACFKDNPGMPEFYNEVLKLNDPIARNFMDEFQKSTLSKPIDPSFYNLLVNESVKVPARVFKESFSGFMEVDFSAQLRNITAPVLLFWGTKDSFCSQADQEQFMKELKNAMLFVYERTGHALHWEQPARFAKDLVAFVTGASGLKM
jgi:non-heme chloroperoxidase